MRERKERQGMRKGTRQNDCQDQGERLPAIREPEVYSVKGEPGASAGPRIFIQANPSELSKIMFCLLFNLQVLHKNVDTVTAQVMKLCQNPILADQYSPEQTLESKWKAELDAVKEKLEAMERGLS